MYLVTTSSSGPRTTIPVDDRRHAVQHRGWAINKALSKKVSSSYNAFFSPKWDTQSDEIRFLNEGDIEMGREKGSANKGARSPVFGTIPYRE